MIFKNFTPHEVNLVLENKTFSFSSLGVARCSQKNELCFVTEENIPFMTAKYGLVEGLPEPENDVRYIVSALVAQQGFKEGRKDLVYPLDFVRNENGTILGCRAFGVIF